MTLPRARAFCALFSAAIALACSDARLQAFVAADAMGGSAGSAGLGAAGGSGGASGGNGAGGSSGAWNGMIDDFEDGDTRPLGGDGWWYAQGDDGRDPEWAVEWTQRSAELRSLALHASGGGYMAWSQVGVDLPGAMLDASAFSELRFWARSAPGVTRVLSVQTPDANGKLARDVEITTAWQEYVIPFSDFVPTDGASRSLDASSISYIQFFVLSSERFDYWLDDLTFR